MFVQANAADPTIPEGLATLFSQTLTGYLRVSLSSSQVITAGTVAAPSSQILSVQIPRISAVQTQTSKASSASNQTLLNANVSRQGVILINTDANTVYVKYGVTATTALGGYSVSIPSGGYWEMPRPIYTGQIDAIWSAAGTGGLNITET